VTTFADADALARAAADLITVAAARAIAARGRFVIALAGGETPRATYAYLAHEPFLGRIDWSKVVVAWGDERCVPPDDLASNYRMARETLLDRVPIPPAHVLRLEGEREPREAAARYDAALRSLFGDTPRFDLILLGLGDDGHTASLFPGTAALDARDAWAVANYVPKFDVWRLTLTLPVLNAADEVVFLVTGAKKAAVLAEVVNHPGPDSPYPAARVQPARGTLRWLVDAHAAVELNA
jgi:6-phosphogluconolactonase